jgi:gluconolactonase
MFYGELEGCGAEIIEPEFAACLIGHARVERLATGCRWSEGPAWFGGGRYLLWSDIPNNRIMRFDETDGSVSVFRQPSGFANGHTVDEQGRLISCEHLHRRLTRTEHDGQVSVLAERFEGRRFNSPNDVVVKSDGSIWFTDPDYGINADYEGGRATTEQDGCHVYRLDARTGKVTRVADDFHHPNGLAFSKDEKYLFVSDTGGSEEANGPRHLRRLELSKNGQSLGRSKEFARCSAGVFDGFKVDQQDRLWTSSAEGVHCLGREGQLLGKIRLPELVANLCFGGLNRNRLFICGTTSLYALYLKING